ncbi:Encodes a protein involved in salt tolerance [Forsythia ovata]|uniref:Encodes a protein involved in salt tolerance n=1 Tax=Forsythia ovata TaxID=205694 RepID=A0ABD1SQH7_9LAMI
MEGGKKSQSGSSFTSDLFGSKNSASASASSGIFGSLFAPPEKVLGRESLRSFESWKKDDPANQGWSAKTGVPDNNAPSNEDQSLSRRHKDINSYFQEEKIKPFHYSSSIYYGGQDVYTFPESTQGSSFTTFNKDETEDDSGMASRGNWWQGSLYY